MEAGDVAGIVDSFAPDAVLHSPFTSKLVFTGREQIGPVVEVILEILQGLRYTEEVCSGDTGFLVSEARVGNLDIQIVDYYRLGARGKIQEFTVFFRPLPATAAALRRIGAGLGRRHSPARGALVSALAAPMAVMARTGDSLGVRLVRP
jgi:hypothetical protein